MVPTAWDSSERCTHGGVTSPSNHPHVHFVVPGGGVSQDGSRWQAAPANFLPPEKAASTVYRDKFRDAMHEAGLLEEMKAAAPRAWKQSWVVDVQPVGDGRATLKYWFPEKNRVRLQPANSSMKPIYVKNAKVLGAVVGVVRRVK